MSSFDKSMRLKGKVEEDRYFAKLDQERVAALHARQPSPAGVMPQARLKRTAVNRSGSVNKQAKD